MVSSPNLKITVLFILILLLITRHATSSNRFLDRLRAGLDSSSRRAAVFPGRPQNESTNNTVAHEASGTSMRDVMLDRLSRLTEEVFHALVNTFLVQSVVKVLFPNMIVTFVTTFLIRHAIVALTKGFLFQSLKGLLDPNKAKTNVSPLLTIRPNVTLTPPEEEITSSACILPSDIKTGFDHIGGSDAIKKQLISCMNNVMQVRNTSNPIFNHISGILFYGPPGCGKTALVKSLGKWANVPLISITPSLLLRKYVGESPQLVRAVFSLAKKLQPCIIFVDEMDSLFRTRVEDDHALFRNLKTEFMQLWDDLLESKSKVLVLGATNRPQDLDAAIQRRFERSFLIGLPDATSRKQVLELLLRDVEKEKGFSMRLCAKMTEGYAPSDLVALCKAAVSMTVSEEFPESGATPTRALRIKDIQQAMQSVFPLAWASRTFGSGASGAPAAPWSSSSIPDLTGGYSMYVDPDASDDDDAENDQNVDEDEDEDDW